MHNNKTMFRSALAFFSRLPVGNAPLSHNFDGILAWFPLIGIIIGTLVACIMGLFSLFLPAFLCGIIGVIAWATLTGGIHLDGVADCGDGLFVETSKDRRLEIMQDSRLGAFGAMALFFILSIKTLTLTCLAVNLEIAHSISDFLYLVLICATAAATARSMNFIALKLPSARPEGLGNAMHKGLHKKHYNAVIALMTFLCVLNGIQSLYILLFASTVCFFLLYIAKKRIGGSTGDVFGCLTECIECAVLLAYCAYLS